MQRLAKTVIGWYGIPKGAYVETEYVAGGILQCKSCGWNITVKDENGDEQTIFIPEQCYYGLYGCLEWC